MASYDVVIVGNGPSALILSYILHGNSPFYMHTHPDKILESKLSSDILLDFDVERLTSHFHAQYSTAALPANVLLDTLLRPFGDTEPDAQSCITWKYRPERAVSHIVLGNTIPGGQWADNPVKASWDIGSLSYMDQLSLPGYTLREHLGLDDEFLRPTRSQVAGYLATYPSKVGLKIEAPSTVSNITRIAGGFHIGSHSISCRHLILASGVFTQLIAPRPELQCLLSSKPQAGPLLVIGSGFSAADIILTHSSHRRIIHIYKWDGNSPLRACHKQAYPEYAAVYRLMKRAANGLMDEGYEGFPNTWISEARPGHVKLLKDGRLYERDVGELACVIGRRGSLSYLDAGLRKEILGSISPEGISGKTLRKANLELAQDVFMIGSLTGDSLIRYAYGGCVFAASRILSRRGVNGRS